jgi:hypothetical protein
MVPHRRVRGPAVLGPVVAGKADAHELGFGERAIVRIRPARVVPARFRIAPPDVGARRAVARESAAPID